MGRPPIGDRAMSSTERVRLWRERHSKPRNETGNETVAALQAEIAELRAQLKANETKRNETVSPHLLPKDAAGWAQRKEEVKAERSAKRQALAEARSEVAEEVAALKAEITRLKGDPQGAAAEQIATLERQLKGARTEIRNLKIKMECFRAADAPWRESTAARRRIDEGRNEHATPAASRFEEQRGGAQQGVGAAQRPDRRRAAIRWRAVTGEAPVASVDG